MGPTDNGPLLVQFSSSRPLEPLSYSHRPASGPGGWSGIRLRTGKDLAECGDPRARKLTQPVLPGELAEALPVSLPTSEKVHRAILAALKHLQGQRRYSVGASGVRTPHHTRHPSSRPSPPLLPTSVGHRDGLGLGPSHPPLSRAPGSGTWSRPEPQRLVVSRGRSD